MPTPEQVAEYQRMKSSGEVDALPPEKSQFLKNTYEPIINPVSKTETALRMGHQGLTGGLQDELAGIGSVIGNSMSKTSALMSLFNPTLGIAGIANDLITDLAKGDQTAESMLDTYRKGRDEARAKNQYAQASNPKTGIISNVVGSFPLMAIAPASAEGTLARLGTSALVGGAYGGGVSEADLTKGDVGGFARDVGLGAGLGVGADLLFMGLGAGGVAASKTQLGRKILTAADEAFPQVGAVVKKIVPSISESGRAQIASNKLKQLYATQTIDDFVKANGGKVDEVMAQKAAAQGFPVQDVESLQSTLMASKASKEAGQSGILRTAVMPQEAPVVSAQSELNPDILSIKGKPDNRISVGGISHWIEDGNPGVSIEPHPDHEGWGSIIYRNEKGKPVGEMSFIKEENGFISGSPENGGINHLYVDPEYRRQGIATKMVNYAKESNLGDVEGALLNQPKSKNGASFVRRYFFNKQAGLTPERAAQIKTQSLSDFVDSQGGFSQKTVDNAIAEGFQIEDRTVGNLKRLYAVDQSLKNEGKIGLTRDPSYGVKQELADKFGIKPVPTQTPTLADPENAIPQLAQEIQNQYASGVPGLENAKVPVPGLQPGQITRDKVAGINLRNISDQDVAAVIQQAAQIPENTAVIQSGTQPMSKEMVLEMADKNGLDPKTLLQSWEKGDAWNRQEMAVVERYLNEQRSATVKLNNSIDLTKEGGHEAFQKAWLAQLADESVAVGGKSEAGAALRFARNPRDPEAIKLAPEQMRNMEKYLSDKKNAARFQEFIKTLDPKDTASLGAYINNISKNAWARTKDGYYYMVLNGALSWINTAKTNSLSNAFKIMERPVTTTGKAILSLAKPLVGKPRTTYFGEAVAEAVGAAKAIPTAVSNAMKTFVTNQSKFGGVSKFGVMEGPRRFAPNVPGINPTLMEYGIGWSGKSLQAADEAAKTINYSMSLHAGAFREAVDAAKKGSKAGIFNDMAQRIASPGEALFKMAHEDAVHFTFTEPLGKSGKAAVAMVQKVPGLKFIQLFTTTPINILKQGVDYTPYGYLSAGLNRNTMAARRIEEKIVKATLGTMALVGPKGQGFNEFESLSKKERQFQSTPKAISMASAINGGLLQLYAEGGITGGAPKDPKQRALFYQNKQPYSVLIKYKDGHQEWKSYAFEPFATAVGIMIDSMGQYKRMVEKDAMVAGVGGMVSNVLNRSFMSGLSNMFDALSDPDRNMSKWVGNTAFLLTMPNSSLVRGVANTIDPGVKKPETVIDRYKSQVPFLKSTVPPIIDMFGHPVVFEGTPAQQVTSMIRMKTYDNSPTMHLIEKFHFAPSSIYDNIDEFSNLTPPKLLLLQIAKGHFFEDNVKKLIDKRSNIEDMPAVKVQRLLEHADTRAKKMAIRSLGLKKSMKSIQHTMDSLILANQRGDSQNVERLNQRVHDLLSSGAIELTPKGEQTLEDIEDQ